MIFIVVYNLFRKFFCTFDWFNDLREKSTGASCYIENVSVNHV